jgi:NADH:ubiquinone oxidoreductase subunit 6 (subunit J)
MLVPLLATVALVGLTIVVCRWSARASASRFDAAHVTALIVGLAALALVIYCASQFGQIAAATQRTLPVNLTFLAPVLQPASGLHINVSNVPDKVTLAAIFTWGWPALLAIPLWIYSWLSTSQSQRVIAKALAWTFVAWAALRFPNGAQTFAWILAAFLVLSILIPALFRLSRLPRKSSIITSEPSTGPAPATLLLLIAGLYGLSAVHSSAATPQPIPDSVTQTIRVEDKLAIATAKIHWQATRGQTLPLLSQPAVMTHVTFPTTSLRLEPGAAGSTYSQQLVALENGAFDIEEQYQIAVTPQDSGGSFYVPTP